MNIIDFSKYDRKLNQEYRNTIRVGQVRVFEQPFLSIIRPRPFRITCLNHAISPETDLIQAFVFPLLIFYDPCKLSWQ
jgi:hypothetical protein